LRCCIITVAIAITCAQYASMSITSVRRTRKPKVGKAAARHTTFTRRALHLVHVRPHATFVVVARHCVLTVGIIRLTLSWISGPPVAIPAALANVPRAVQASSTAPRFPEEFPATSPCGPRVSKVCGSII
jgi:hypothetical protein